MSYILTGAVPHSGNKCSGLCQPGCPHPDCWQCAKERSEKQDKAAAQRILQLESAAKKANVNPNSLLGRMAGQKPEDWQKATITRGALEGLAQKAGVRMDWNNGNPVFYDDDVQKMEKAYADAEKQAMAEKLRELERIAAQEKNGNLTPQVANSMARAAANQMDKTVSEIIKENVDKIFRDDIEDNEARVIAEMKAKGASDADIKAVQKIAGWKSPADHTDPLQLKGKDILGVSYDEVGIVPNMKTLLDAMRDVGYTGTPTAIVHPKDWQSIAEAMKNEEL